MTTGHVTTKIEVASEINVLSHHFLRMYPIKDMALKPLLDHLSNADYNESENIQQQLLYGSVKHPTALKYPPSSKYCQMFLKMLIAKITEANQEVLEDLFVAYTNLLSLKSPEDFDSNSYCYRTYCPSPSISITLKETQKLISEGTTGMFTWQASHILANWCRENELNLRGRRIIELGAGLGFTGLSIIMGCRPKSYTFTDLHATVLKTLKENVRLNLCEESSIVDSAEDVENNMEENFRIMYKEVEVSVERLDWNSDEIDTNYDMILAADVVYDKCDILPIAKVLKQSLERNKTAAAYVASTIRNPETFSFFKDTLQSARLKVCSETHHTYKESPSKPESHVVLLQIELLI